MIGEDACASVRSDRQGKKVRKRCDRRSASEDHKGLNKREAAADAGFARALSRIARTARAVGVAVPRLLRRRRAVRVVRLRAARVELRGGREAGLNQQRLAQRERMVEGSTLPILGSCAGGPLL